MIDTLPESKQARTAEWFSESERKGDFNWRELASFFRKQFEDKQARQTAASILNRMEQGHHQFFDDFLRDFEHRVAQNAVNSRLRRALISVKLPSPENYQAWIEEVREVAKELESLSDYRPKGASQTKTILGAPKSGSAQISVGIQPEISKPKLDSDGDTVMGRTNAVLAAIKDLMESNLRSEKNPRKTRAPWRSKEEFKSVGI
ncbi:hypothetical protein K3495_g9028 [Podosphaera aphanis]|nr:hypothetical protein K3495_g9028 [Podosphaera aphanis]